MTAPTLSPRIDGRIFVVGVPRSGTTLVQSLLAAHGAVTSFTESHLFARHFTLLPLLPEALLTRDPTDRLREFLAENGEEPPATAAWFDARRQAGPWSRLLLPLRTRPAARRLLRVFDELALRRGAAVWVEKTPRHLRYVPFLERLSGAEARLRFVHVIRDGLEVVASLNRASQRWERPYDLDACVRRWNADVGFALRRVGRPRDRFLFYEELTSRPEETLRRLFGELGLDWEPQILDRYAGASRRLVGREEAAWKAGIGRPIRPSATSGRELTEDQRRRVARALRRDLYERIRQRLGRPPGAPRGAG